MRNITEYTEQEIDALTEGRGTDVLVAEFVEGWIRKNSAIGEILVLTSNRGLNSMGAGKWEKIGNLTVERDVPHYSTDISAAWLVEERMKDLGFEREYAPRLFDCVDGEKAGGYFFALAHATPLQRCKAALKAVRAMKLREAGK